MCYDKSNRYAENHPPGPEREAFPGNAGHGIKQEALAFDLGDDWNQKKVSLLEQKEVIDTPLLEQISSVMKIPVEAFQNFDEEQAINIISNTFDNCNQPASVFYNSTINPLEQLIRVHKEKIVLYERMLKEKDEMMARLEKVITGKKKSEDSF